VIGIQAAFLDVWRGSFGDALGTLHRGGGTLSALWLALSPMGLLIHFFFFVLVLSNSSFSGGYEAWREAAHAYADSAAQRGDLHTAAAVLVGAGFIRDAIRLYQGSVPNTL
jgi:hypothetical protein